jgi:hypothetical protein
MKIFGLLLVLLSALSIVIVNIQPIGAQSDPISTCADGSIRGIEGTQDIQIDGNAYTQNSISGSVVEKANIVIDGAGTLQGSEVEQGLN